MAPAMKQTSLEVTPTHTIYTFEAAGVTLTVSFFTPAFPKDLDVLSRPVTYLTLERDRAGRARSFAAGRCGSGDRGEHAGRTSDVGTVARAGADGAERGLARPAAC